MRDTLRTLDVIETDAGLIQRGLEAAMVGPADPLDLNLLAYQAGTLLLEARQQQADAEAGRKPLHHAVRDELVGSAGADGKPRSRTAAEEDARSDERYLAHVAGIERRSRLVERLQLVYETARQRASLGAELARIGAESAMREQMAELLAVPSTSLDT